MLIEYWLCFDLDNCVLDDDIYFIKDWMFKFFGCYLMLCIVYLDKVFNLYLLF